MLYIFDEERISLVGSKALKVMHVQIAISEVINVLTGTINFETEFRSLLVFVFTQAIIGDCWFRNSTEVEINGLATVLFDRNEE
jgi:hypothetical protein